jgi:hypothetical protein
MNKLTLLITLAIISCGGQQPEPERVRRDAPIVDDLTNEEKCNNIRDILMNCFLDLDDCSATEGQSGECEYAKNDWMEYKLAAMARCKTDYVVQSEGADLWDRCYDIDPTDCLFRCIQP